MKKIFFCTIPMLPSSSLKAIKYRREQNGMLVSEPRRFPATVMLDWNLLGSEDIKIVTVMTDDDNGRCAENYKLFKEELEDLSKELGKELKIDYEIKVSHDESRAKQVKLFKEIASQFDENSEIYMDVTYGTKITSIGLFASLTYAEKMKNCTIKSIVYGKYSHNGGDTGEYYDVRSLYELAMFSHAAYHLPKDKANDLLNVLWGDSDGN